MLLTDRHFSTCLALAYIRPIYDLGGNDNSVPFVLNSPSESDSPGPPLISTYRFDNVATEDDSNFWTVYLLNAYQCDAEGDFDPFSEHHRNPTKSASGVTDEGQGQGSSVFMEMFAEFLPQTAVNNPANTAAHEIGHLFNGDHTDGGLMSGGVGTNYFYPITLRRIRGLNHP